MIDVTSIAVIAVLSSAQQQFRALEQHPVGAPKLAPAESLRLKFADPGTGGGGSGGGGGEKSPPSKDKP